MLKLNDGRKVLYQWDVGVTATVTDSQITEVHFSNLSYGISFSVEVADGNVLIPPEVLQNGADVYCWAYVSTDEKSYTKKDVVFNVIKRPKPSGYIYTPTDIETLGSVRAELLEKIDNIVVDTNNIKDDAITIEKTKKPFFYDGIDCVSSDNIELTKQIYGKQARLKAVIKKNAITTNEVNNTFFHDGVEIVSSDSIEIKKANTQYTGKKVQFKVYIKNEVKEINEESTDEERPTAKAVVDYVNTVIGGVENGSY